ncbi:MAG: DUF4959 domain-containing protein [Labilibaculum sp.]|nr:DUF4959 domain-containing protein [Labilibaculum sp.]
MKALKSLFIFILVLAMMFACDEDDGSSPLEHNMETPGTITNLSVENLPGKAIISYTLPSNQDLLYVKAMYTLPSTGKEVEVKSSSYNNNLTVEGFFTTNEQEIKLYAVNRSEVTSDPVPVTIKPLESPIWEVFRSVEVSTAFGGFNITAENSTESDVVVLLMSENENDEWEVEDNSIYTSTAKIASQIRGLDTISYDYALTVRDRWLNYTDTLYTSVVPLYEALIPKSGYVGMFLTGDAEYHPSTSMSKMWDDNIIDWPNLYMTQSAFTPTEPHIITFDIGLLAKISRVKIWDYPEYYNGRTYYYLGCMKRFEIWGTDDPQAGSSLDDWSLLGTFEATKPSGLPYGEQNDEDYNAANAGFDWEVDINAPKVRYLRIRSLENWGGSTNLAISELQVYGDPR